MFRLPLLGGLFFAKNLEICIKVTFYPEPEHRIFFYIAAVIAVLKTDKPEAGMNSDFNNPDIFSRREAAIYLGVCRNTLDSLDIPRTKIGRRVMYKREVLNIWIDDHTEKTKKVKS